MDTTPVLTDGSSTTAAVVGDTVKLAAGTYAEDPGSTAVQDSWYDCSSSGPPPTAIGASPVGCTLITPAPSSSYVVRSSDAGKHIAVLETDLVADAVTGATNQVASNTLAVTAPTPPPAPPTNLYAPSISGQRTSGSTVTAVTGGWTGSGNSYAYSWMRCKTASGNCASRGTGPSLTLTSSDVGAYLLLTQTATATNAGGSAKATANSAPFGPITTPSVVIAPPAPPSAGAAVPTVSGTPQVGATLTATPVTMSQNPTYAYQWLRCAGQSCTAIPGAAGATYSPGAADLGDTLAFSETGTNAGGSGQAQSAKTAAVTAPTETTLQITPAGVVAGQTATLIATVTSAAGQAPPLGAITFEQAGTAIPGCASMTTRPEGASATVTCQAAFSGSSSELSAVFTPNPSAQVTGSDSSAVGFVLGRAATTATMIVPARVTLGKRLNLTAKVVPQPGTTGVTPTGDVVFLDGKQAIKGCSSSAVNGVAHCAVSYKALGTHSISAVYLGDTDFSGSSTNVHTLAVVVPKPTGFVSSLMTWTFRFQPRYTRVSTLLVTGVQPGLTISVGCSGAGCPKHRYVDTVTRATCGKHGACKDINLATRFAHRKLGVGAALTVRLTHPGWLGKYYSFVVRPGRRPKIDTACLAVGQTRPGAGCTPR